MFLFGAIWTLVFWVRRALECFKHCLMGHTSRNMKDNEADNDLKCQELTQEVSEENFCMLPRNSSCYILVMRVTAFCPCPKTLPEKTLLD